VGEIPVHSTNIFRQINIKHLWFVLIKGANFAIKVFFLFMKNDSLLTIRAISPQHVDRSIVVKMSATEQQSEVNDRSNSLGTIGALSDDLIIKILSKNILFLVLYLCY
jgi:hypothetical protein